MGYDYTKKFLELNAATVNQVTEVYNSGNYISMAYDTAEQLNAIRFQVSNVLASLALNYPKQFADVREKVRTWSLWDRQKEQWILFVGHPRHKLAGRKPGLLKSPQVTQTYGPPQQTGRVEEVYSKVITSTEEFEEFARWVATIGPNVELIRAELDEPPDNQKFLQPFKAIGWKPNVDDTTITLKRPRTKLEDRNA